MLNIYVTTYSSYVHLLENFDKLFQKFWGGHYTIDVAREEERLSDQLLRLVNTIPEEYFILLKEDFYLLESVDKSFLEKCEKYAIEHKADRFSLQCVKDGYENTSNMVDTIDETNIYQLSMQEQYLCSLEASIWRRDFLRRNLFRSGTIENGVGINDGSDANVEITLSRQVKEAAIFVPEKRVIVYTDAMRGGKPRVKFIENEFFMLSPDGWISKGIKV